MPRNVQKTRMLLEVIMLRKTSLCVLMISVFSPLFAEETNALLNYYDAEIVKTHYDLFGGLTISYRGVSYGTLFGLDEGIKSPLSRDFDVKSSIDNYSSRNLYGNIGFWVGLVGIVGGAWMIYNHYAQWHTTGYGLIIGSELGVAGVVDMLVGGGLISWSRNSLVEGVNAYDRNRIRDYK
jgi:hypothetical protein